MIQFARANKGVELKRTARSWVITTLLGELLALVYGKVQCMRAQVNHTFGKKAAYIDWKCCCKISVGRRGIKWSGNIIR